MTEASTLEAGDVGAKASVLSVAAHSAMSPTTAAAPKAAAASTAPKVPAAPKAAAVPATSPTGAVGPPRIRRLPIGHVRAAALVSGDLVAVLVSLVVGLGLANWLRTMFLGSAPAIDVALVSASRPFALMIPLVSVVALSAVKGHYVRRKPFWSEYRDILLSVAYGGASVTLLMFALNTHFSRSWIVLYLLTLCIAVPVARGIVKRLLHRFGLWRRPAIVIGDGPDGFEAARVTELDRNLGLRIVKYVDIEATSQLREVAETIGRGGPQWVGRDGRTEERPHVIFSVTDMENFTRHKSGFDLLMKACPSLTFLPPMRGLPLYDSELLPVFRHDTVMLRFHNKLKRPVAKRFKRLVDLMLACAVCAVTSPLLLVLWGLVRRDGGPALYAQERLGEHGRPFRCLKFRSMVPDADARLAALLASDAEARRSWDKDHKLKVDPRITPVGRFLRATSLDELPQLLNVLRGEMSFVGPRPIVRAEIERYGDQYDYYTEARPGITGLWQVSGRNDVCYAERVALDVWYVRNWSPWLDIVILLRTVPIVLLRRGAY